VWEPPPRAARKKPRALAMPLSQTDIHMPPGAVQVNAAIPRNAVQGTVESVQAHMHPGSIRVEASLFKDIVIKAPSSRATGLICAALVALLLLQQKEMAVLSDIISILWAHLLSLTLVGLLCRHHLWPSIKRELVAEWATATATAKEETAIAQEAAPAPPPEHPSTTPTTSATTSRVAASVDAADDLSQQLQTIKATDGIKAYFVHEGQVHELWRQGEGWTLTCLAPGHPRPDRRFQLRVVDDDGVSVIYRTEDGNVHEIFIGRQTGWSWESRQCTNFSLRV
jgi:hypothetical protein